MKIRKFHCLLFLGLFFNHFLVSSQYNSDDWKWRDGWMDVAKLFEIANLEIGASVADVGCHEGYLSMHLAKEIGPHGQVYSVDVRNDRLNDLKIQARKRKLKNIRTILGAYDNPKLPKATLDVVYVIDTYHEMDDYKKILAHLYTSLKTGGKIVILEKLKKRIIGKSRSEQTAAHSLSIPYVKQELKEAGFRIQTQIDDFGLWEEDETKVMWVLVGQK